MKFLFILFLFSFSTLGFAEDIWTLAKDHQLENKVYNDVRIDGVITHINKRIYARDSIFDATIKDVNSEFYFKVEVQTIKWLKRINYFECEKDQLISLRGNLDVKIDGER